MFGQASKDQNAPDRDVREPLLNDSRQNLADNNVVFSVTDDDEEEENTALDSPRNLPGSTHSVTFREDVQIIGPSLRSTIESREAGM
jgi:solute carrier family 38 (sodium-coupled neutral amino acid transporter), member 11